MLHNRNRGFSLVELMCVVAIIGVFASMGRSSYRGFVRQAKQAEAKLMVKHLGDLYKTYVSLNGPIAVGSITSFGVYPWLDPTACLLPTARTLGFTPNCTRLRYFYAFLPIPPTYVVQGWENRNATARAVFIGCPFTVQLDAWVMTEDGELKHSNTNPALVNTEGFNAGAVCPP
jgi:prepilin-type N-terminal cleavage/methylation domain-containing protein